MHIEQDIKLDFKDVLIRPKRSTLRSRSEVTLERQYSFLHSKKNWKGIPIIASNIDHTGTFEVAKILTHHQLLTAIHKFVSPKIWEAIARQNEKIIQNCFISSGMRDLDFERTKIILDLANCPFLCLDVANGYSQHFVDFIKKTRTAFPDKTIMAGNVVTGEMVEELVLSGTDIVKVGIGPGSVCTTREKTGIGYPQLSAIIECADAAHGLKGHICADGGCTVSGDIAKAFAAGADFVMVGGMFAGHDECEGDIIEIDGKPFKRFYGMSSAEAMIKYHGEVAEYRASEGKSTNIPYRGPIEKTVLDTLGGLRSACTYVGAASLKELSKRTTFIRVTQQLNEVYKAYQL
jgi:GMP reductase